MATTATTATTTVSGITTTTTPSPSTTPAPAETTPAPSVTAEPSVTVTAGADSLSAYLGVVMPIVVRHNATRDAAREAGDTFAMAPLYMNPVPDYRDALAALKPDVDAELADAAAVVPPAGYEDFHASLVAAITHQRDGITLHLQYYTEVAENGTAEQALYDRGAQAFVDANQWPEVVLPRLQQLIEAAGS